MARRNVPCSVWLPWRVVEGGQHPNIPQSRLCSRQGNRCETCHLGAPGSWAGLPQWAQWEQRPHRNKLGAWHMRPGRSGIVSDTFCHHPGSPARASHLRDPKYCSPAADPPYFPEIYDQQFNQQNEFGVNDTGGGSWWRVGFYKVSWGLLPNLQYDFYPILLSTLVFYGLLEHGTWIPSFAI